MAEGRLAARHRETRKAVALEAQVDGAAGAELAGRAQPLRPGAYHARSRRLARPRLGWRQPGQLVGRLEVVLPVRPTQVGALVERQAVADGDQHIGQLAILRPRVVAVVGDHDRQPEPLGQVGRLDDQEVVVGQEVVLQLQEEAGSEAAHRGIALGQTTRHRVGPGTIAGQEPPDLTVAASGERYQTLVPARHLPIELRRGSMSCPAASPTTCTGSAGTASAPIRGASRARDRRASSARTRAAARARARPRWWRWRAPPASPMCGAGERTPPRRCAAWSSARRRRRWDLRGCLAGCGARARGARPHLERHRAHHRRHRREHRERRAAATATRALRRPAHGAGGALAGMCHENTTRGPGWRFLDAGRRIERALLAPTCCAPARAGHRGDAGVETVALEIADSAITYRSRYLASLQPHAVLDLLLTDDSNPRSCSSSSRRSRAPRGAAARAGATTRPSGSRSARAPGCGWSIRSSCAASTRTARDQRWPPARPSRRTWRSLSDATHRAVARRTPGRPPPCARGRVMRYETLAHPTTYTYSRRPRRRAASRTCARATPRASACWRTPRITPAPASLPAPRLLRQPPARARDPGAQRLAIVSRAEVEVDGVPPLSSAASRQLGGRPPIAPPRPTSGSRRAIRARVAARADRRGIRRAGRAVLPRRGPGPRRRARLRPHLRRTSSTEPVERPRRARRRGAAPAPAACARTSTTSRSPACARSGCRRATSAATCAPTARRRGVAGRRDASHAWFSVRCGELGWIRFDPTNDSLAGHRHMTVATGGTSRRDADQGRPGRRRQAASDRRGRSASTLSLGKRSRTASGC